MFVYQIYFPDAKEYYFGITTDTKTRLTEHQESTNRIGKRMQKFHYSFDVLFRDLKPLETAREEIRLIAQYRQNDKKVLNLTEGGEWHWTKEEAKLVNKMRKNPLNERNIKRSRRAARKEKKLKRKANAEYWKERARKAKIFVPKTNAELIAEAKLKNQNVQYDEQAASSVLGDSSVKNIKIYTGNRVF